jgi:hypothetical protein
MRKLRTASLLLAIAGPLAASAALAHPPAPVDERGRAISGKLHTWMHQAKVPLVRGRVQIRRQSCPGHPELAGCVFTARPRTFYMRPSARDPRTVLYHELGHAFDLRVLNQRERGAFKRIVGIRRRGWFNGALPPAEWFADAYAGCAYRVQLRRPARRTAYGYRPTRRQHARVCLLIRKAAAPKGRRPRRPNNPPPVIEVEPPPPQQSEPESGPECNLVDQLVTGCKPPSPTPPPPPLQP